MAGKGDYLSLFESKKGGFTPLSEKAWNKDTRVNIISNRSNAKAKPKEGVYAYDITPKGPFIYATEEEFNEFMDINTSIVDNRSSVVRRDELSIKTPVARKPRKNKEESEESEEEEFSEEEEEEVAPPARSRRQHISPDRIPRRGVIPQPKEEPARRVRGQQYVSPEAKESPPRVARSRANRNLQVDIGEAPLSPSSEEIQPIRRGRYLSPPPGENSSLNSPQNEQPPPQVSRRIRNNNVNLENQGVCKIGTAGTVVYVPNTKDPRELPQEALTSLCDFHFGSLKGWGKVVSIQDGDTIDLVIYVPLNQLTLGVPHNRRMPGGKGHIESFAHTQFSDAGFFAKTRSRLYGIDAMEHGAPEGDFATAVTKLYYNTFNNNVWFEFREADKYGRSLVDLYNDESKKIYYNDFLFQFNRNDGIPSDEFKTTFHKGKAVVVERYGGEAGLTKSEYSKSLNAKNRNASEKAEMSRYYAEKLSEYQASLKR